MHRGGILDAKVDALIDRLAVEQPRKVVAVKNQLPHDNSTSSE